MNTVFFANFLWYDFRSFSSDCVDFLFNFSEYFCFFKKSHIHIYTTFYINFLVKWVVIPSHFFVIICIFQGFFSINFRAANTSYFFNIRKYVNAALFQDFFCDITSRHDCRCITSAENTGTNSIIIRSVFHKRGVGCMSRSGSAVCVLVLLNMNKVPVKIGYENYQRCSVSMVFIPGVFYSIG